MHTLITMSPKGGEQFVNLHTEACIPTAVRVTRRDYEDGSEDAVEDVTTSVWADNGLIRVSFGHSTKEFYM
ncbi:hypothetical protein Desti_3449 [Desulfomonile tiedjei DSM 6799]|uniref:Uncharacterized protein n=1 Tax=Desulfomonile tiedjei (strain ATCC 49306 / DSM 6799 / DCB-1) TaxID=706587 RepID=I4C960_DESTA|nr:hypothetical protein Desti_3449 [Desulfomonile tiedjei DSM 6799]